MGVDLNDLVEFAFIVCVVIVVLPKIVLVLVLSRPPVDRFRCAELLAEMEAVRRRDRPMWVVGLVEARLREGPRPATPPAPLNLRTCLSDVGLQTANIALGVPVAALVSVHTGIDWLSAFMLFSSAFVWLLVVTGSARSRRSAQRVTPEVPA
ncbi:MAG: hypothetical protein HZB15_10510 [Actinobacteria bacterium]|nr:hypothetical protein [Actinomycetota bacterium]